MDELGRELPANIDAEQALLGGLMLNNVAWDDVAEIVSEQDFFRIDHKSIFSAMRSLAKSNLPFDPITIADSGEQKDWAYVVGLARSIGTSANVRSYARIVKNKALERGLLLISDQISRSVY